MNQSQVLKRKGHHKRRAGCKTCKARHLKCDEERPHCNRCVHSGRSCEGYDLFCISQHSSQPRNDSPQASISPFQSWSIRERSAFETFRLYKLNDIPGTFYEGTLWNDHILQLSVSTPVLLNAIMALGAIELQSPPGHFAFSSYNKAIQGLVGQRTSTLEQNVPHVLLACILFATYELYQGAMERAEAHISAGLRIFDNMDPIFNKHSCQTDEQKMLTQIRRTFQRLVQQLSLYQYQPVHGFKCLDEPSPATFASRDTFHDITGARNQLNNIGKALRNLVANASTAFNHRDGCTNETLERLQCEQVSLLETLECWDADMQALDKNLQRTPENEQACQLLQIHFLCCKPKITMALEDGRETSWDNFMHEFRAIIELATAFATTEHKKPFPFSGFLLDIAILSPLYFVIRKCRHPQLRRSALLLIASCDHREGPFDASSLAEIGQKLIDFEEQGLFNTEMAYDVPEHRRIESVTYDMNACPPRLMCRRRTYDIDGSRWLHFSENMEKNADETKYKHQVIANQQLFAET